MSIKDYTFAGFSLFVIGMLASNVHKMQNRDQEVVLLKHEVALYQGEAQILRDQIADMTYQFSSRKTYEDGVMDGIHNSKNEDWVAGYHFCCEQFAMDKDLISKNK
jgi:hypothetical protein